MISERLCILTGGRTHRELVQYWSPSGYILHEKDAGKSAPGKQNINA